jgi:ADP-heptose:LPS heptosyltransferase
MRADDKFSAALVYRLSSLGDVALVSGVLDYWFRKRGLRFVLMTKLRYAELFEHHPAVLEVVGIAGQDLRPGAMAAYFRNMAARFSGLGFIDLHGSMRSRLLGLLWRGPVRRCPKLSIQRRIFMHTHSPRVSASLCAVNVAQRYALALESTAPEARLLAPKIYLTLGEIEKAACRLGGIFGGSRVRPVALHPYATHSRKEWPAAHWQKLMSMLDREHIPWMAVGQGQRDFLPELAGDRRNLTNATSLRELCALLAQSALLITGDSGPMHLAAAVNLPVLALFGPTTREWGFYPTGARDRVLELSLPCRPCSLHGAGGGGRDCPCMRGITPEQVFAEAVRGTADCNIYRYPH